MLPGQHCPKPQLLQMLMGEDLWECCTAPSLQLLLQYAHLEDLPELAEQLLQHTDVEMTDAVWCNATLV